MIICDVILRHDILRIRDASILRYFAHVICFTFVKKVYEVVRSMNHDLLDDEEDDPSASLTSSYTPSLYGTNPSPHEETGKVSMKVSSATRFRHSLPIRIKYRLFYFFAIFLSQHVISKGKVCVDFDEAEADPNRTVSFLPEQLFVLLAVVWVDFNNWGFMSNLLPFAMSNAAGGQQQSAILLSYALQLSALCLVLGDLSTFFIKIPIPTCLVLFTCIATVVYAAAGGVAVFEGMGSMLVCLFGMARFIESHLTTSVFNYISNTFPASMKEDAIRFLGLADMIAVTFGVTISAMVVSVYFPCSAVQPADDDYGM